jgi:hypothetical protein
MATTNLSRTLLRGTTLLNKIKNNAFLVVGIFFLWQGWSGSQVAEPEVKKKEEQRLPAIRATFIREGPREVEAAEASAPRDPFSLAKMRLAASMAEKEEAMSELGVHDGGGNYSSTDAAVVPQLALNLQSTMKAGGVWIARINGHTLRIGDALPDFDEESPPVVVSIEGSVAQLRYNEMLVTLDIAGEASVSVE